MRKTNCEINGTKYYRIQRKVGKKLNKKGLWVDDIKSFYGKSKKEAEEKYHLAILKEETKHIENRCLGELLDEWIEVVFKKAELANATKIKYISAYERLFRGCSLAGMPISRISVLDMQKMYNELPECYSSRRALHNLLGRFYKYAVLNDLCSNNITVGLNVPKEDMKRNRDIEVWADADLKRLIRALDGSLLKLLVVLAANTGARFSELLALTYDDIEGNVLVINKQVSEVPKIDAGEKEKLHLTTTKTENSNRWIPLTDTLLKAIEEHKELQKEHMIKHEYSTNFLFTSSNGTLLYKRDVARSIKRTCERFGIPYHKFHAFRSTFATNLSRQNVALETCAELLGHSSVDTTKKFYVNISADRRKNAIERIESFSLEV